MRETLSVTGQALTTLMRVLARRPFRGPKHPDWSARLEASVELVRDLLSATTLLDPAAERRRLEALERLVPGPSVITEPAPGLDAVWFRSPVTSTRHVVLYFHGGGYALGSADTAASLTTRLALCSEADVLSVNYRLAPEAPFPAAVDDAVAAYQWLTARGTPPDRIVLAGDSAGGGLSIACLLRLRDMQEPMPAAAALISPWVDLTGHGAQSDVWQGLDTLEPATVALLAEAYIGSDRATNPLVSPVLADLSGLPPLLIQAAECELFGDQIAAFASAAKAAGVDATHEVTPSMIHAWHYFAAVCPQAVEGIERIARFARERWFEGSTQSTP